MHARATIVMAAIVSLCVAPAWAQGPNVDDLILRAGDYVQRFVEQFSNVVAEEDYEPDKAFGRDNPRLRSDYLLVRHPSGRGTWLTFRDVVAVNGLALNNHQEQITKLFLQQFDSAVQQANAITRHSARYVSPRSDPLLAIALLQHQYQPRFKYTLGERDDRLELSARRIRFEETSVPTILRRDNDRDLPTRGSAWVVEGTGRVVRTELEFPSGQSVALLTTTFKRDDTLGIDVPGTMRDSIVVRTSTATRGVAYYTHFRRFAVRTEETIDAPKR